MSKRTIHRLMAILIIAGLFISIAVFSDKKTLSDNKEIGDLDVAFVKLPNTMDPQKASNIVDMQYLSPCVGLLYRLDSSGEIQPELARDYEVSDDQLTYTIHLRDEIKYSDGTPITAQDFVYGFRRVVKPDEASSAIYLFEDVCKLKNAKEINEGELPVEELGIKAKDNQTLEIQLEEPCPYFLYVLAMVASAPCNERFVAKCNGKYATSPETMLASGAFYVDRYEPLGIQVHYKPNPYYIDDEKVNLSGMTFRQVASTQQAEMAYQSGIMDVIAVSRDYLSLSLDDPNLKSVTGQTAYYMWCSFDNSKLQSRNIRVALSKAIDRDKMIKSYFRTGYDALTRIVPENCAHEPDGEDFAGEKDRYAELSGYDPEEASNYWQKGLKDIGASELELDLITIGDNKEIMEILKNDLEKTLPGCTINVRTMPTAQFYDTVLKGDYELAAYGWGADCPDPNSFLELFVSNSNSNSGHYNNPEYDALQRKAQKEKDPEKRFKILHQQEDMLMNDMVVIPLYAPGVSWLISDRTVGVEILPSGNVYCNYADKK